MINSSEIPADQIYDIYEKLRTTLPEMGKWPAENEIGLILGAILVQNTNWRNVELALNNLREQLILTLAKFLHFRPRTYSLW